jgi:hypothetical protein
MVLWISRLFSSLLMTVGLLIFEERMLDELLLSGDERAF